MLLGEDPAAGVEAFESDPRINDISVAAVCRRHAKFMKEMKIASCISRLGSLCSFLLFGGLTGAALAQQNTGSEDDILDDDT